MGSGALVDDYNRFLDMLMNEMHRGLEQLVDLPGHPYTGHLVVVSVHGKYMRYSDGIFWIGAAGTASRLDKPCSVCL